MSEQQNVEKDERGYVRDASWWSRPNTTAPKRVHGGGGEGFAACSRRIMLDTDSPIDLAKAAATTLCGRCFPSSNPSALTIEKES